MQEGYNADSLHGELSQAQRDAVMQKFRIRNLQLLVATDVAARGLDVDDLTHVINYGLPEDTESYTHRSGRTGRAGKTGTSIAIINLREKGRMREIERKIGKTFEAGKMPTAKDICERQLMKVIDDLEKVKVNEEEIADFMPDVYRKLDWLSKEDLIKRMVSHEFNRFSDYYRDRAEIETAGDTRSERKEKRGKKGASGEDNRRAEPGFTRFFINLGKNDHLVPNELIGLINSHVRGRVEIGRIDLMRSFSFFEVEEEATQSILKGLNRANWKGRKGDSGNSRRRAGKHPEESEKKHPPVRRNSRQAPQETCQRATGEHPPARQERRLAPILPARQRPALARARFRRRRLGQAFEEEKEISRPQG